MKLSTQILLAFSIVLLLSLIDSYTNYRLSQEVQRNTEYLEHSENIIRNSSQLHKTIIEMQSAFRGFLLTDDYNFLNIYNNAKEEIPVLYKEQRGLNMDSPTQLMKLDSIYDLHKEWILYSNSLITAKKEALNSTESNVLYIDLFNNKLKKQVGKKLNDRITLKFDEFDRAEYKIRHVRRSKLMSSIERTHRFSLLFLSLTVVIGLSSTIYIVTMISRRISGMVKMAENISKGDFTPVKDTRNDELTGLSKSLNIMSNKLNINIRELEKRNAELNQFAYVVSHDLKAPVRGIYNVIQWIREDMSNQLSQQLNKYLDIISQRTKRMEDLINGLLDYARLREKSADEQIDMKVLVSEIAETIIPRTFKFELQKMPVLRSERIKLEQVFSNLISNAVKYTPEENGHIVVSCRESAEHYEFSVKDNGIGIDPEYHQKIFDIFQTLREKDEKESTGIGLAITKKIIDDLHGSIRVISQSGQGAEFIFTWPRTNHNT